MRKLNKSYELLDSFVLRLPVLSTTKVHEVIESDHPIDDALSLLKNPKINEALCIASPSLLKQLAILQKGNITDPKKRERAGFALVKYLFRMATRCTPFGLFSAVSTGYFTKSTTMFSNDNLTFSRRTRLDFGVLSLLFEQLTSSLEIQKKLEFIPNSSLYSLGEDYRYVMKRGHLDKRKYHLKQVVGSENLRDVLRFSQKGKTIEKNIQFLVDQGYDITDAQPFIESLIQAQLLLPSIQPFVIGKPYFPYFIQKLESLGVSQEIHSKLREIETCIIALDQKPYNPPEIYLELRNQIQELVSQNIPEQPFQVDLFSKSGMLKLSNKERKIVLEGLDVLMQISSKPKNNHLEQFKQNFQERYSGNPVRLIDVLDIDHGLGYPIGSNHTPYWYVSDLHLTKKKTKANVFNRSNMELFLIDKLNTHRDTAVLQLTDADLCILEGDNTCTMPPTFYALTERIVSKNNTYYYMPHIGGSTAGALLGRFSGHDKKVDEIMRSIAISEQEHHKGSICAEIAHVPEERTGNILFREPFRPYVIPFLSGHQKSKTQNIPVDDLYLSLEKGVLVLRSQKLGKKIIPYLSNAHNYANTTLPIYRFLCDFQYANKVEGLGFQWGNLEKSRVKLPRVAYKNIILSKAKWNFKKAHFSAFKKCARETKSLLTETEKFQKKWGLPKYVSLVQGDNLLFLNLQNEFCLQLFLHEIRNKEQIVLEEFTGTPADLDVSENGDLHNNQILFMFTSKTKDYAN